MFAFKRALCLLCVVCLSTFSWSATNSCKFKRGDSDGNGVVQITDAQHLANWAYQGGPAPPNKDAADANDDGAINTTDSDYITAYLFAGGPAPPDPGPTTADCDPTIGDIYERSCTPEGGMAVFSVATAPSTIAGVTPWDCNNATPHATNPSKVDIYNVLTEETDGDCWGGEVTDELTLTPCCDFPHDPCDHPNTQTKWTFTWDIVSVPYVERLAFNTGCTKLHVKFDWRADFPINLGACTQEGGGCPGGDDWYRWKPQNVPIEVKFQNSITSATHTQQKTWWDSFMPVTAKSWPKGQNPCAGLNLTHIPGDKLNFRSAYIENVGWSGNDAWELVEIKVHFLVDFDRLASDDNSDTKAVLKKFNEWSIWLQTFQYINL